MIHIDDCKKFPMDQQSICCEDQMCPCDYDEFRRLIAENTRLREALMQIADGGAGIGKLATPVERMIAMSEIAHDALDLK